MRFSTIIFGGTFDPPHTGHISLVDKTLHTYSPDRFLVITSPEPPHKDGVKKTSFDARFLMTKLSFNHFQNVEVSDIENELPKPSFTFQTLQYLKGKITEPVGLLIGSDSLQNFDSWYRFEEILKNVHLIVYPRSGSSTTIPEKLADFKEHIHILQGEFIEFSSTQIRQGILSMENSLHPKVLEFIRENNLYQS